MTAKDISQATTDNDTLGGRLVRARAATGMTTGELAARLGVMHKTLNSWETDRSEPRSSRLNTLAGVLNVSTTWLLYGRGAAPVSEVAEGLDDVRAQLAQLRELHKKTGHVIRSIEKRLGSDGANA